MRRCTPIVALLFLTLLICLSCTVIDRPTVPVNQRLSYKYFSHVVRFNGETLGLVARWYTKNEQNADRIAQHNLNLTNLNGALAPNSRVLIPRSLLKTEKLMPAEFVMKHADGKFLIMMTPVAFRTGSPSPTPTPTPTITPTDTPTPLPTVTPTPQPTSTLEPTPTPDPTSTPEPTSTVPPTATRTAAPELERFDLEQPPHDEPKPNKQLPLGIIEIPGPIMQDLKDMVPERSGDHQPQQVIPSQQNFDLPSEPPPPVSPTFNYQEPPEIEQPLPTISDERRKLLDRLKQENATRP